MGETILDTNNEAPTQEVENVDSVAADQTVENATQDNNSESTVNENESVTPWYDSLSEDVKNHEGFDGIKDKIKDVDGLTLAYINAQKLIGQRSDKGIEFPDADSPDEVKAEFWNKLGRPEKADDYEWENRPEGLEVDSERLTERNSMLHELGLTNDQYQGIMDMYAEEVQLMADNWQQNEQGVINSTTEALKEEWGGKYDANLKAVAKVADKFGVKDALMESGVINHKPVIDMLYKVHQSITEDGVVKNPDSGYSKEAEIKQIRNQMKSMNAGSKEYKGLQQKLLNLYNN